MAGHGFEDAVVIRTGLEAEGKSFLELQYRQLCTVTGQYLTAVRNADEYIRDDRGKGGRGEIGGLGCAV